MRQHHRESGANNLTRRETVKQVLGEFLLGVLEGHGEDG